MIDMIGWMAGRGRGPVSRTLVLLAGMAVAAPGGAQEPAEPVREDTVRAEEIVVVSTRTGRRIEDEPVRVEVLGREEVEEKMLMTPGDIAMMLNETSGLRVQPTSPALGGAGVRIQGLRGRYTQLLADGLPLYGGQSGALGMLQIPPMDLGQVEVIKGVASALYGGSALGGVVNLISRRPDGGRELLLNQTTRGGTDAVLWSTGGLGAGWAYTFLGGAHRQSRHDVDGDGWADLAGYERVVARPRLFWSDGAGRSLFLTVGGTAEDRAGGTLAGRTTPAGTEHRESLGTRRLDAGAVGRVLFGGGRLLTVRASASGQRHAHRYGGAPERDRHATAFGEAAVAGTDRGHTWVLGGALQHEGFRSRDLPRFDYGHTTVSAFAQDEVSPAPWATLSASGRLDAHSEYGTFASPRLSLLLRPGAWTARLSAGTGYFAPTPFVEATEGVGLARVAPLDGLVAERAAGASLDVGRELGAVEVNATLFASRIRSALIATRADGDASLIELRNASRPTRTWGTDLLARYHQEPFHLNATYTYTRSTEEDPESGARREVPLTPRHAAGLVGMWEAEDAGRVGLEVYYTGAQALEENPYRARSRPYWILGFLVERRIGGARVFLNAENLLDARQTRHDPLLLPARSPEGRWTTDAWAPLDGRTFNAGVRLDL
jgi:outer membrane receptor for ferrienterochelin and colicins